MSFMRGFRTSRGAKNGRLLEDVFRVRMLRRTSRLLPRGTSHYMAEVRAAAFLWKRLRAWLLQVGNFTRVWVTC